MCWLLLFPLALGQLPLAVAQCTVNSCIRINCEDDRSFIRGDGTWNSKVFTCQFLEFLRDSSQIRICGLLYGSRRKKCVRTQTVLFIALVCWLWLCFKHCFKLANILFKTNIYKQQKKDKLPFYFSSSVFLEACQSACVTVLTSKIFSEKCCGFNSKHDPA